MSNLIEEFLKRTLSISSQRKLRLLVNKIKSFIRNMKPFFFNRDLNKLGKFYMTDKIDSHNYTPHYMTHLKKFRLKKINLLEIGVGGYDNPISGGNSLRMWKKYFSFGKIFSLDIYDKSALQENRIRIFRGSQVDKNFLDKITEEIGEIDIIIDDGSHINEHVIETFNLLFPKLKNGGIYIIEDIQTSYRDDFGGDSKDLNNTKTTMNYFKSLTDELNSQEYFIPDNKLCYFDNKIVSMHFYHNLIIIYKGENDEKSILGCQ